MDPKFRILCLAFATFAAGVALAGLLLLLPQASQAQSDVPTRANPGVLYVTLDGDDANTCITFSAPCRTIQAAVDSASTGDTIRVASGVYTGVSARAGITQVVYISKSVTIQGGYTATNWTTPHPITRPTTLVSLFGLKCTGFVHPNCTRCFHPKCTGNVHPNCTSDLRPECTTPEAVERWQNS